MTVRRIRAIPLCGMEQFMLLDTLGNVFLSAVEIEQTGLFPFPFGMYIVFCLISLVFFTWRFSRDKKPYQLIFAFAIPFSMILLFFDTDKAKFQIIGIVEGVFILAALISTFVYKKKTPETETHEEKPAETEQEKPVEAEKEENSGEEKSE